VYICGVDDAGRGSMLGPLVIAGVSMERKKIKKLSSLGVRDSKKLSPSSRERLRKEILKVVDDHYVVRIQPTTIDSSVRKHQLNYLEAKYMAKVITKLTPDISYVDCCDVNTVRFGKEISKLSKTGKVRSFHHADSRFVIVSAASILAKVARDKAIAKLKKNYDLGSGYPSDQKTVKFVKKWITDGNKLPAFVRKSWKPVRVLLDSS